MMICNNPTFTGCVWESYAITKDWSLTAGEGTKNVYVKYKDNIGLLSQTYTDSISLSIPDVVSTSTLFTPPTTEPVEEVVPIIEPIETTEDDNITKEEIIIINKILSDTNTLITDISQEEGVTITSRDTKIYTKGTQAVHLYKDDDFHINIPVDSLNSEKSDIENVYAVLGESIVKLTLSSTGKEYIGSLNLKNLTGTQNINILAMFKNNTTSRSLVSISVDPYGYVYTYDKDGNQTRVKGAQVYLYQIKNGIVTGTLKFSNKFSSQIQIYTIVKVWEKEDKGLIYASIRADGEDFIALDLRYDESINNKGYKSILYDFFKPLFKEKLGDDYIQAWSISRESIIIK